MLLLQVSFISNEAIWDVCMCAVMKVRIKRFMYKKGHTKIHIRSNKKKIFRWPESIPKPKKIFLWMKGGLHCTCSVLSNNKTYYIVAGWMQKNKLTLYSITKWNRKYKKVVRRFKRKRCSSTSWIQKMLFKVFFNRELWHHFIAFLVV